MVSYSGFPIPLSFGPGPSPLISYVPNILTLLRILACPFLILLLHDQNYAAALGLAAFAGVTDALDGYIAKRFNCTSRLGALLDPLADKVLIISAMAMLALSGDIPLWLLVGIVFRDLVIVGGWLMLTALHTEVYVRPSYLSKVNTTLQITLALAVLFTKSEIAMVPAGMMQVLIAGVAVTTVLSLAHYLWIWAIQRGPDAVGELRKEPEQINPGAGADDD